MERIINEMNEALEEIHLTVSDFQRPTPELFRNIFSRLMEDFDVDMNNVSKFQLQDGLQENVDIVPELNFLIAMKAVFPILDVCLFDILSPTPKKFFELITQAWEYYKFCDKTITRLESQLTDYREAKDALTEAQKRKQQLSKKLHELAIEKDNDAQLLTTLKSQVDSKRKSITDSSNQLQKLQHIKTEDDKQLENFHSTIRELKSEQTQLKSKLINLKKDVVNNPEVVLENLKLKEQERQKVAEQKDLCFNKLKTKTDLRKQLTEIKVAFNTLHRNTEMLDMMKILEGQKALLTQLKNELSLITTKNDQENEVSQLDVQIQIENELFEKIKSEMLNKEKEHLSRLEQVQRSYQELLAQKSHDEMEYRQHYNELKNLNQTVIEHNKTMSSYIARFNATIIAIVDVPKN